MISIQFQRSDVLLSEVRIKDETKKRIAPDVNYNFWQNFGCFLPQVQVKSSSPLLTCFPRKIADTDPVKVQNLLLSRRKEMDKGRDEDWGGPHPGGAVPRRWKPQWTPNLLRPTNLFPARLEFRRPRTFFRYKRWIRNLQNPQENVCRSDLFYCKGDCQKILSKPGTIISH